MGEAGLHHQDPSLRPGLFPRLPLRSPHCLSQVHKFVDRNRDHLDPAVVEMLAQSQLQVSLPAFSGPPPLHTVAPTLPRTLLPKGQPLALWTMG